VLEDGRALSLPGPQQIKVGADGNFEHRLINPISERVNRDSLGDASHDSMGRPTDSSIRNTNPGTMHVIDTNYLGIPSQAASGPNTHQEGTAVKSTEE
jgi:hypothetical protein